MNQMKILKTNHSNKLSVIITAAGSSTRIGSGIKKEYLPYKNGTVLSCCAKSFLNALCPIFSVCNFIITTPQGAVEESKNAVYKDEEILLLEQKYNVKIQFVEGGKTRQESVFNGLDSICSDCLNSENTGCVEKPDFVLIHDGARPFVSKELILKTLEAAFEYGASVPGITPTDTQKEIDENGFIVRHLKRKNLSAVQTPQCFKVFDLYNAHKKAALQDYEYTDDTEIWGEFCGRVNVVAGDVNNIKITYPADLEKLKDF